MTTGDWTTVPPSELCYSVSDFMDGELSGAEAENFRHHLARCEYCTQRVGEGWLLDERLKRLPASEPKRDGWKLPVLVPIGVLVTLVVVVAVFLVARRGGQVNPQLEMAKGPPQLQPMARRYAKVRLPNQPYLPMDERAVLSNRPSEPTQPLSAEQFSALGERLRALEGNKDYLGAASTLVEWGLADQAASYLERHRSLIQDSEDKDVLEAAIWLEKKEAADPEQALEMADRALRRKPGYPPALWNRGLALLRLKLPAAAERTWQEVAGQREPGWSGEAIEEAKRARGLFERRRQTHREASESCRRMIETGEPIPEGLALSVPGLSRACLYKAARAARSLEQVSRLLPLAKRLDALDGGDWLKKYVTQVAGRSFAVRGPLAEKYRPLALGPLPDEQVRALLETLRRSSEADILLGALGDAAPVLRGEVEKEYREALARTAKAGDRWLLIASQEQEALRLRRNGDVLGALGLLNHALADCVVHTPVRAVDVGCAFLRRQLVRSYTETSRTTEAREQGQKALELASLANEWTLELKTLADLGLAESQGGHGALALGLFDEVVEREPDGCKSPTPVVERPIVWDVIQSNLASEHLRGLDFDAARKDIAEASECHQSQWLSRYFVLADLARRRPPTREEIAAFDEELAHTASTLKDGYRVMALHIQGRFQSEVDPVAGRQKLREAITEADKLPRDDEARKARTYSYTTLILAAGKKKAFDEALSLFGEELRSQLPKTCVLAVAAEDERSLVVVRGTDGAINGSYRDDGIERPELARGLIPDAVFRADLRGCASIRVIARPPLAGKPGLIPDEVAWSYFGGTAAGAGPIVPGGVTLLVTSPSPPPELGLKTFEPISLGDQAGPGAVTLQGADATPERVVEEMQRASAIYVHAHGMLTDPADPALLALSPGAKNAYQLTAGMIRSKRLAHGPIVILIACDGGHAGPYLHQVSSLPAAFLEAGASMVFAATTQIPTDEGPRFFQELMKQIRAGADPAVALRDAKQAWRAQGGRDWVQQVLLFQSSAD